MSNLIDGDGNNILHRIALSSNAVRFFDEVSRRSLLRAKENELKIFDTSISKTVMTTEVNTDGDTFLHILAKRSNIEAFDSVLDQKGGLAWDLTHEYDLEEDELTSLREYVDITGNAKMQGIIRSFLHLRECKQAFDCLKRKRDAFPQQPGIVNMVIRFYRDWVSKHSGIGGFDPIRNLIKDGCSTLFRLFYEADKDWFWNTNYPAHSRVDHKE